MSHISNIYETGISSTKTLNINCECQSMSEENVDVARSPDLVNTILKNLSIANVNHLICAQLNINSIGNKLESLKEIVSTNVDIVIFETFNHSQFHIHGFGEPYRFDRTGKGGGILLCIRDDMPSELIESKMTIALIYCRENIIIC